MLNKHLVHELESGQRLTKRYRERMQTLQLMEKLNSRPSLECLERAYLDLKKRLNLQNRNASLRTHAENTVLDIIQQSTSLRFYRSMWIGNQNVDLFCPAIGTLHPPVRKGQKIVRKRAMRGVAVEVDGPIHDSELKMRKDTSKYKLLDELDIGLFVVHNVSVDDSRVKGLLRLLKRTPRLPFRTKRRLMRNIYVVTLAYHASDETMIGLYGQQFVAPAAIPGFKAILAPKKGVA